MADPLLTSLCSICHIAKPQYRCPRCAVRTCSLACVKKHKAWSQCSGERDATVYVPRSRLRTAAGVDHDYNFLHGIELAAERAERVLVADQGIIQAEELRPLTTQEVRWKTGRDGRKRKVLVTRVLREAKGRVIERHLAQRLAKLNTEMLCAPKGMSRQKENHTTLNRRTGRINWQVEWFGAPPGGTRVLSKVMEDVPLYKAYHTVLEDQGKAQGRLIKRVVRPTAQSCADSTWHYTMDSLQDASSNGAWVAVQGPTTDAWPGEKEIAQHQAYQFFLPRQQTRGGGPTIVTRLDPEDILRQVLANTRVLEFPKIYVLKKDEALPLGFVVGPKDVIQPKPAQRLGKRKGEEERQGKNNGRPNKRRMPGVGASRGRGEDGHSGEEDNDEEGGVGGGVGGDGLEVGEVIAEQELMGDDDVASDDDATSSSGSDSDGGA